MTRESRDARQDSALVSLLQALPEDRLDRVLAGIGIEAGRKPKATDDRRCTVCGRGYVGCRAADRVGDHEWSPNKRRGQ